MDPRPTCAAWRPRSTTPAPRPALTVATTRSGAQALRDDGWGAWAASRALPVRGGPARPPPALRAGAAAGARPAGRGRPDPLAGERRADPHARHTARDHPARRDVLQESTFNGVTTFGMRQVVSRAARHADALIAVTQAARDEIVDELDLDPARFSVVHHGATLADRAPARPRREVRERLRPRRPPRGAVRGRQAPAQEPGAARPRGRAAARRRGGGARRPPRALRRRAAKARRAGSAWTDSVVFADYVPDDELEALWEMAGVRRVPHARRGLRDAGAGGAGARRAGGVLRSGGAARDRRRAPALLRPGRSGGRGSQGRHGAALPRPLPGAASGPQDSAGTAAAEGTWRAYERALAR